MANDLAPTIKMQFYPTIVRLRADDPRAGRYGMDIANGRAVYAAYDGDVVVAVAATAGQARRAYRREMLMRAHVIPRS
jgi:hypothetical protein